MRELAEQMLAYRIGDPNGRYPIYSGEGATRHEGRWHRRGQEVIYASEHYSTSMLEKLVHFNGVLPSGQHFVTIKIPARTTYEVVTKDSLSDWTKPRHARVFGAQWIDENRSAILLVPSYVARMERNVLINPNHPQAARIRPGLEEPVWWDDRLLAR